MKTSGCENYVITRRYVPADKLADFMARIPVASWRLHSGRILLIDEFGEAESVQDILVFEAEELKDSGGHTFLAFHLPEMYFDMAGANDMTEEELNLDAEARYFKD